MSFETRVKSVLDTIKGKFNVLLKVHDKLNQSGVVVVDYSDGSVQQLNATAAITDLSIANWPAAGTKGQLILFITMSSDLAVTFSGISAWASGSAPTLTTGLNELVFTTIDGGTKVIGHAVATGV